MNQNVTLREAAESMGYSIEVHNNKEYVVMPDGGFMIPALFWAIYDAPDEQFAGMEDL